MFKKKAAVTGRPRMVVKKNKNRILEGLQQTAAAFYSFACIWLVCVWTLSMYMDVFEERSWGRALGGGSIVLLWGAYYFLPQFSVWLRRNQQHRKKRILGYLLCFLPELIGMACCLWWYQNRKIKTVTGFWGIGNAVLEKWNAYYGTPLPYLSGIKNIDTETALLFLFFLTFWWILLCVFRWKKVFLAAIPGIFLFALDLLVGYVPGIEIMAGFVLGIIGILPACQGNSKQDAAAGWLCGIWPAAGLALALCLAKIMLPDGNLAKENEETFLAYQKNLEAWILEEGVGKLLKGESGRISNETPEYEEKTVMTVEASVPPEEPLYLRGYVGEDYKGGVWGNAGQQDFAEAVAAWPEEYRKQAGSSILNMPYLASVQYWGEMPVTYEIAYLDTGNDYAYFPYNVNMDSISSQRGITLGAESLIFRQKSGNISAEGQNIGVFPYTVWDMPMGDEEQYIAQQYEAYLERYLIVPENLRQIRDLSEELNGELLREYGAYLGDYQEGTGGVSRESMAVFLVRREIFARAEYSLELEKVPVGEDVVEHFLFSAGKGFCQHYASAGALLLRGMGVPARYVTGYVLGPERFAETAQGEFAAEVKDSDAHAWVEIYFYGIGWVPVEMTEGTADVTEETEAYLDVLSEYADFADGQIKEDGETMQDMENPKDGEDIDAPQSPEDVEESEADFVQDDTEKSDEGEEVLAAHEDAGGLAPGQKKASETGDGKGNEEGNGDGKQEEGERGWYPAVLIGMLLFLSIGGGFILWRRFCIWREKEPLRQQNYKRAVRILSNRIYRMLRRKGGIRGKALDDRAIREAVLAKFGGTKMEELERYFALAEQAAFGNGELTFEDVRFCYDFYQNLKLLK